MSDAKHEADEKIGEIHSLEHQLQEFLAQRQLFQIELNEIENALNELEKTNDEVYKIISGIMMKSDKKSVSKELEEKKNMLSMRISSIEKQEKILDKNLNALKKEIDGLLARK